MGLHLENDEDAGMILEKMMEKFEIDLDDAIEDIEKDGNELTERRKEKRDN
ncbi:MAG: hypothetical protein IKF83_04610 [Clostridia bacterium]|nr:hypothetical protein [Clostridia bacterium]